MKTVLVRPDLAAELGVGHVMRCLALGEELTRLGHAVTFACDTRGFEWIEHSLASRGIVLAPAIPRSPEAIAEAVSRAQPDFVVIDSYTLTPEGYAAFEATGVPALALVDNELRGARAAMLLDQNIGSERDWPRGRVSAGTRVLAGLNYALIRSEIRRLRPSAPPQVDEQGPLNVLSFFGGSDALGVAPATVRLLAATQRPFAATVITSPELVGEASAVWRGPDQSVNVVTPLVNLHEHIVCADLVISAAGSSTWELAALGAAVAAVPVADNQVVSYQRALEAGAVAGLGSLADYRATRPSVVEKLNDLMDSAERRRTLRDRSWALVDGRGAERVAEALLTYI